MVILRFEPFYPPVNQHNNYGNSRSFTGKSMQIIYTLVVFALTMLVYQRVLYTHIYIYVYCVYKWVWVKIRQRNNIQQLDG